MFFQEWEDYMNELNLEKTIRTLEQIRDILLDSGIRSEGEDATLQRICNQIDTLYGELLEAMKGKC